MVEYEVSHLIVHSTSSDETEPATKHWTMQESCAPWNWANAVLFDSTLTFWYILETGSCDSVAHPSHASIHLHTDDPLDLELEEVLQKILTLS